MIIERKDIGEELLILVNRGDRAIEQLIKKFIQT